MDQDDLSYEVRRQALERLVPITQEVLRQALADDAAECTVITRARVAHMQDVCARVHAALEAAKLQAVYIEPQ